MCSWLYLFNPRYGSRCTVKFCRKPELSKLIQTGSYNKARRQSTPAHISAFWFWFQMRFFIYFFIHRVGLGTGSWSPTKTPPTTHPNGGTNNRAKDRPQYQSYLHQFRTRAGRPPSRIFIIVCSGGAPNLRIFTISETITYTILSCQSRPKFWNIQDVLCPDPRK